MHLRHFLAAPVVLIIGAIALSQPAGPAAPKDYDVTIRYRIDAVGNDRIIQYFGMVNYLKAIGFVREAPEDVPENEPDDPKATQSSSDASLLYSAAMRRKVSASTAG